MKPNIYIIQKAFLKKNENPELKGSFNIRVAIGLIEYEKGGDKKYMVIDACQLVNWPEIKKNIENIAGSFKKVTHLLLTHTHIDHIQNIAKFDGRILFLANKTSILGKHEYGSQEIYPNGYIEIPEIKYEVLPDGHTHDDTIYVIDSENKGQVIFLGDLIFTTLDKLPVERLIAMEKRASINPAKKFFYLQKIYKKYPNAKKFYSGHNDEPITRECLNDFINTLDNSKEWQRYLKDYIKLKQKELKGYEKRLK